ncbi:MAG: TIGR01459 family HAD-type hydrolase [Hyphomonadaceae bacterium]|nr:TIGR01459 family HAD-type hydrolase [Hyphomonadaceae bacterium]
MTQPLNSIEEIAGKYEAIFCDVWGVIHNGRRAYAEACAALARLRAAGKPVILVTNVPKPRGPIPAQLDRIGVPRESWDAIATSGDAIRAALKARAPGPMLRIGPKEFDAVLWEGLDLIEASLQDARFVAISGLNREDETPADYANLLRQARARDLEMICANPDIVVRVGDRLVWCAGAIARDYAALGGRVVMAGKPHAPIYDLAFDDLAAVASKPVRRSTVLCIGDGLSTDIAGANAQGLDSLLIASGMHGEALWSDGALDLAKVEAAQAEEGVRATYVMAALA